MTVLAVVSLTTKVRLQKLERVHIFPPPLDINRRRLKNPFA